MKKLLFVVLSLIVCTAPADAKYVKSHMRRNGTFVSGYNRTRADRTKINNYSSRGNRNPFTGKRGTKSIF